jgi:hypothetical protein
VKALLAANPFFLVCCSFGNGYAAIYLKAISDYTALLFLDGNFIFQQNGTFSTSTEAIMKDFKRPSSLDATSSPSTESAVNTTTPTLIPSTSKSPSTSPSKSVMPSASPYPTAASVTLTIVLTLDHFPGKSTTQIRQLHSN